jgi:ubiquinone/menaquinone biosynthesis C-methylase UbiE
VNRQEYPVDPRVERLFRLWSPVYDSRVFQRLYYGRVHERLLAAAGSLDASRILDVGCGTGELLLKCLRRWPSAALTGVDLSAAMLERARTKTYGKVPPSLVEASVYALPLDVAAFDLVFNSISSHFYVEGERAFREIARVTRPGGTFLQASVANGVLARLPGHFKDGLAIPSAIYRSPEAQSRLLEASGFQIVRVTRVMPVTWLYECRRGP